MFEKSRLEEARRWAVAVTGESAEPRITLTYPALESSRQVAFLVCGSDKRAILTRLLNDDAELPAARLRPAGPCHVFADAAAGPQA